MAGFSIQGLINFELKAGLAACRSAREVEREAEGDERSEEGDPVGKFGAIGQERNEDCAGQRDQQNQRENRLID